MNGIRGLREKFVMSGLQKDRISRKKCLY
uniref:Uncharacterized protein n=1 Tax=Anguilla anguilla TaxID=7936 RepID=A0A0E9TDS5_ANGAN